MPSLDLSPLLHYEVIAKTRPEWKRALEHAAQGNGAMLDGLISLLRGQVPVISNFLAVSHWYQMSGQQVFCLGPRFQAMLHATDCESVPRELLKPPYECFYVALPDCSWRIWGGNRTGMHPVAGAYLYEDPRGGFNILIWGKANDKSFAPDDDASFSVSLGLPTLKGTPEDPTCINIEAYLLGLLANPEKEQSDIGINVQEASAEMKREHDASVLSVTRLLVNLVLYLNSTGAETFVDTSTTGLRKALGRTQNPKKRRRIERQIGTTTARITWVGRSLEQEGGESQGGTGGSGTWAYRRGHFHAFWTGPRKDEDGNPQKGTERILQWVKPVRRDQAAVIASQARVHKIRGDG